MFPCCWSDPQTEPTNLPDHALSFSKYSDQTLSLHIGFVCKNLHILAIWITVWIWLSWLAQHAARPPSPRQGFRIHFWSLWFTVLFFSYEVFEVPAVQLWIWQTPYCTQSSGARLGAIARRPSHSQQLYWYHRPLYVCHLCLLQDSRVLTVISHKNSLKWN